MILDTLHSPLELRTLSQEQLRALAKEIRLAILNKTSQVGGHVGPNLGIVEVTLALHHVFSSPQDKLVFDVSHQTYPHKILTGRAQAFLEKEHFRDISGFASPQESEHDPFTVGHTSTSIPLALGLARARDLQKQSHRIVAIIGDGALSGGEAFEGLDIAGTYKGNLTIVLNDNDFSIAPNQGGLYANLKALRKSKGTCAQNYFKDLGLDYVYVVDGHDLEALIETFSSVKDAKKPVVVHVHTKKGKGYIPAEKNPELFHSLSGFDLETGTPGHNERERDAATLFGKDTYRIIQDALVQNDKIVALNAATPGMMGFGPQERIKAANHFIDVGIAEPAAVSLAAGLAKGGAQPIFAVRSSFVQRAYDQIAQDVCIDSLPVTLVIFTGSLYAMHDVTHQGLNDIPLLSSIPNLNYLCPATPHEYEAMLSWSLTQHQVPVAIKLPGLYEENESGNEGTSSASANFGLDSEVNHAKGSHAQRDKVARRGKKPNPLDNVVGPCIKKNLHENIPSGISGKPPTPFSTYQVVQPGSRIALLGLGTFLGLAQQTAALLEKETGIHCTVINPRFASGVDRACLEQLKKNHEIVVTLEDGRMEGGFGQKIAAFYGTDDMQVLVRGLSQELLRKYTVEDILHKNGLTAPQLVSAIRETLY